MSRIGRMPVIIPAGVTVDIEENNKVTVKGPKGTLVSTLCPLMTLEKEANVIHVKRPDDEKETRSLLRSGSAQTTTSIKQPSTSISEIWMNSPLRSMRPTAGLAVMTCI